MRMMLKRLVAILLAAALAVLPGCAAPGGSPDPGDTRLDHSASSSDSSSSAVTPSEADGDFQIVSQRPDFGELEGFAEELELYGELDSLGRCTPALVRLGLETVPTEGRGQIGSIMPTGYHSVQYDCVPGGWLYNRCHMVAFQLAGQNDNIRNLITGTRQMNLVMKRFEDAIRVYIEGTGNHVIYRVSPDFAGDELVARGVRIEALSVEDGGAGVSYDVYIPNVQDGIVIDYATGESRLEGEDAPGAAAGEATYVLNTNTKRFHRPDCASVDEIKDKNRENSDLGRDGIVELGYEPCGVCEP